MEGHDRALVLEPDSQVLQRWRVGRGGEGPDTLGVGRDATVDDDIGDARLEQLAAVVADVGDRSDRDDLAGDTGRATTDAGDDAVALGDRDQQLARLLRDVRVGWMAHDRRKRAVDVEQHGGAHRISA